MGSPKTIHRRWPFSKVVCGSSPKIFWNCSKMQFHAYFEVTGLTIYHWHEFWSTQTSLISHNSQIDTNRNHPIRTHGLPLVIFTICDWSARFVSMISMIYLVRVDDSTFVLMYTETWARGEMNFDRASLGYSVFWCVSVRRLRWDTAQVRCMLHVSVVLHFICPKSWIDEICYTGETWTHLFSPNFRTNETSHQTWELS